MSESDEMDLAEGIAAIIFDDEGNGDEDAEDIFTVSEEKAMELGRKIAAWLAKK